MSARLHLRFLGIAAVLLSSACGSTDPGPDPLPEPTGKLLLRHVESGRRGGLVVRDVATGSDTMISTDDGATLGTGLSYMAIRRVTSPYPSLIGPRRVPGAPGMGGTWVLSRHSLVGDLLTDLYHPDDGYSVTYPDVSLDGGRAIVPLFRSGVARRLVEVDLATGAAVTWWASQVDDDLANPRYDPLDGSVLLDRGGTADEVYDGLVRMTGPGSEPTLLLPHAEGRWAGCYGDVARDGRIVYTRHDGTFAILLRPGVTRRDTVVTGVRGICPVFSPDGEFLAYLTQQRIWLYRFRDGRITPLPREQTAGHDGTPYVWW